MDHEFLARKKNALYVCKYVHVYALSLRQSLAATLNYFFAIQSSHLRRY